MPPRPTPILLATCMLISAGCTTINPGDPDVLKNRMAKLQKKAADGEDLKARLTYYAEREKAANSLVLSGYRALAEGQLDAAGNYFQSALTVLPNLPEALRGLRQIQSRLQATKLIEESEQLVTNNQTDKALAVIDEALRLDPSNLHAARLKATAQRDRNSLEEASKKMTDALVKPVTLQLRDVSIVNMLDLLSQSSGLNFLLDKDVKPDTRTTLFVKDTSIKDVLKLVMRTNQLEAKVLNASTFLIYPSAADKNKQYEDLTVKSYFLKGENAKRVQEIIQTMVNPKFLYLDEKTGMLVVRDNRDVISLVDRMVSTADTAKAEVVLDVEILEVSTDVIKNLGIQYPTTLTANLANLPKTPSGANGYSIEDLKAFGTGSWRIGLPDPLLVANLKYQDGAAETLANPKIRVQSKEKAKIQLGDKVPVITTTTNQTSSAITESISYLDVGLRLEATPDVHPDGEVTIEVDLEVSNIVKEIRSVSGLLTYQIGTRNTKTTLRSQNGETQILAGLIKREDRRSAARFPLLGQIPLLGKLFSNENHTRNKSEIVLLITPHIVRNQGADSQHLAEFASGSLEKASTEGFLIGDSGEIRMGQANGREKSEAQPTVKPEAARAIKLLDMNNSKPALFLNAPAIASKGNEFVVTISSSGSGRQVMALQLDYDSSRLQLIGARAADLQTQLEIDNKPGNLGMRLQGMIEGGRPLIILTMKATDTAAGSTPLTLTEVAAPGQPAPSETLERTTTEVQVN